MTQHTSGKFGMDPNPMLEDFRWDEYFLKLHMEDRDPKYFLTLYLKMLQDPGEITMLTTSGYFTLENIEYALRVLKRLEAFRETA